MSGYSWFDQSFNTKDHGMDETRTTLNFWFLHLKKKRYTHSPDEAIMNNSNKMKIYTTCEMSSFLGTLNEFNNSKFNARLSMKYNYMQVSLDFYYTHVKLLLCNSQDLEIWIISIHLKI